MPDPNLYIGVNTQDLPTISAAGISATQINIGGLHVYTERGIHGTGGKALEVRSANVIPAWFGRFRTYFNGHYVLNSFFKNLQGEAGKLFVNRLVPSDAITASMSLNNASAVATWKLWAGRLGQKDPGAWGNQLMVLSLASSRGASTLAVATALNDPSVTVVSAAPFAVGDWVTVSGASSYNAKVTAIDEPNNILYLSANATGVNAVAQAVTIIDRTLVVYLKDSDTGQVAVVETLSNLTTNPVSPYYFVTKINDQSVGSGYLFAEQLTTPQAGLFTDFPVTFANSVTNAIKMTLGADGTTLTTLQLAAEHAKFDSLPILYLSNAENQSEAVWDDGEAYCNTRKDCIWVGTPTSGMNFAAAQLWAYNRQKSRKVYAFNNHTWINVDDPLGTGPLPVKAIPNVGMMMGYTIWLTTVRGVHKVPASRTQTPVGIRSLVGEIVDKAEMRDLANIGLNCISDIVGSFAVRSGRTPSKLKEWQFVNALIMSIYFKKSFEQSLIDLENEPNTVALIQKINRAMTGFALAFYQSSSNGGTESGFASFQKSGGGASSFNDVVKIVTDDSVNTIENVNAGELHANFYFMPPPPAERILVGVGLLFNG